MIIISPEEKMVSQNFGYSKIKIKKKHETLSIPIFLSVKWNNGLEIKRIMWYIRKYSGVLEYLKNWI